MARKIPASNGSRSANTAVQGGVGAEHEDRALGQIDNVQDAEDEGKTEGKESVNSAERKRVDELLREHALFLNHVLIRLGHHDDRGLHGVVARRLAVAPDRLAKLERSGCAAPLNRGQRITQRFAIRFELSRELDFF